MSAERPQTSKPRGICKYYTTPRGCFAGSSCRFLHGVEQKLTMYDQSKTCKFYAAGYCRRGADCWFLHRDPGAVKPTAKAAAASTSSEDEEHVCSICLEKPVTFGLLAGCDHVFCLQCIRQWRNPPVEPEGGAVDKLKKCCPLCRIASQFVTPSSHFYPSTDPGKATTIDQYKASMARVPCRYFQASFSTRRRFCPFGKDCFYQHKNKDGTDYVFEQGVDHYIKIHPESGSERRFRGRFTFGSYDHTDAPWIEELSATLDAIRASLPDFLQQPMDEEEESENEDHQRPLQAEFVEQLRSEPFAALLQVLNHYESEDAAVETSTHPSTPSSPFFRPQILHSDDPPRAFDLFPQVPYEEAHYRPLSESSRISIEPHAPFSTVTDRNTNTEFTTTPSSPAERPLVLTPPNEIETTQYEAILNHVGNVAEAEDARPTSLGDIPTLTQSEEQPREDSHPPHEDAWSFDSALQAPEPPVLTDGRGRVVWSTMSASRTRNARSRVEHKSTIQREAYANSSTSPPTLRSTSSMSPYPAPTRRH